MDCQKKTARLPRMKNTRSKIKPIETGKEIGTTYCLRCQDYTHNFKPQEVKMKNQTVLFVDLVNQAKQKYKKKKNSATTKSFK